jgi:hypothetical protein
MARKSDSPRQPADRTIAVAIVDPVVEDARVEVQVSHDLWLRGHTNVDGYVAFQWSDSLGDSVLEVVATGYAAYQQSVHWKTYTDPDVGPAPLNDQMTVGANLPPLTPLAPPTPIVPPADEAGAIAVTHPTMSDANGSWRWKGFSDFLLFYRYLIGEDITALLDERLGLGVNVFRVFAMVAWSEVQPRFYPQDFSDYHPRLKSFIALLQARHARMELSVFPDGKIVMPDEAERQAFLRDVVATVADAWNVFIEVGNEPFQNLPGGDIEACELADGILDTTTALVASGAYHARSSTEWRPWPPGDFGTTHCERSDEWPRKCKDIYDLAMDGAAEGETRVPWIGDEPMGCADANEPGRRSNVPLDFAYYAAGCAMFGPGATFHPDVGTHSAPLTAIQRDCGEAFYWALDWVPRDAPYWDYQRGDMGSEAGIGNMPVLHDDALEIRSYAKTNPEGTKSWAIQIRTSRAHATPRDGWRVVSEPYPGFVYLERP